MTLFSNPALSWTPRMAVGRNSKITGRAPRMNPDTLEKLRRDMAIQQKANKEHAYVVLRRTGGPGEPVLTCLRSALGLPR